MLSRQERIILAISHAVLILASAVCVVPFLLLIMASVAAENSLIVNGYRLVPKEFSFAAYEYLWLQKDSILRAYGITIISTAIGTAVSLIITVLLAYPLSMLYFKGRKIIMFLLVFSMLFNGGLVPTYIMYTQYFHLKNT
ncbi:MAG: carbohydrate ABC transporter permease, partial [Treponema sp.]|nr:carbohydrate ABC transporter permease [Treponema sp.]